MRQACTLWQCDLTAKTLSMQGLQKWWPQGVESGWLRIPLHSLQWNSLRARSWSVTCNPQMCSQRCLMSPKHVALVLHKTTETAVSLSLESAEQS